MEAAATSCTAAPQLAATDRTNSVFPQPGGPDSSTPRGQLIPSSSASAANILGHSVHTGSVDSACCYRDHE